MTSTKIIASRKYRPQTTPRPPLAGLLLLTIVLRITCFHYNNISRINCDTQAPVTVTMEDFISHHSILVLCTNNKTPGTYRGTACRSIMSMRPPRACVTMWIILAMCGDVESNPGPTTAYNSIFPCGVCGLEVVWSDDVGGVACDQCDIWYHADCIGMNSTEYEDVANISWRCYKCHTSNCSSFIFNGYNVNVSNSFQVLAGIPGDDSVYEHPVKSPIQTFAPTAHSSPSGTHIIAPPPAQSLSSPVVILVRTVPHMIRAHSQTQRITFGMPL